MRTVEAASYLGMSGSRLRQLVKRGDLAAEREETSRGPVLWFTQTSLDTYRKQCAEQNALRKGRRGRPHKAGELPERAPDEGNA